jgi:hypothetical protein
VFGVDAKTKIALSPTVNTTIQAEGIYKYADHKDTAGTVSYEQRSGFYAFTDFHFGAHYNAGILYEQYQSPDDAVKIDRGVKPFVGFAVLEESTLLRLAYERFFPEGGTAFNSIELQFLFSMGPHKAHQF